MSGKMTTLEMMRLAETVAKLPRKNRDELETILREKRLVDQANVVAAHNLKLARSGEVSDADAAPAVGKGQDDKI